MQSRFILMEAASIALALVLVAGVLGLSFLIRSQLSHSIVRLQERMAVHAEIQDVYDRGLVDFWRAYRGVDEELVLRSREDMKQLQNLLAICRQTSESGDESAQDSIVQHLVNEHDTIANRLLASTGSGQEKLSDEQQLRIIETQIAASFSATDRMEFQSLSDANRRLGIYNRLLYVLLVALGLYPIGTMVWLRRAQERSIWQPLDQLYGMVMEVKKGNLKVTGEIPETVELGTVTAAFLSMAEELADMRDSLEEKVRLRASQLEAANRDLLRAAKLAALGQLVSGVAHEINNPLTSILGFSEVVLSRPGLEASLRSQLQTIRTEAIRLKHLVANLSTFSRRAPQNFSHIDLRTVPDHLLQLRSYQLSANNIRVSYDRPVNPVWVNADGEQLLEVLLHLVLNSEQAIRSVRDKGEIRLACEACDGQARVTVEDDGCGMPEDVRENIFDPFFTTKPTGRGTGLGLSIAHTIVHQHGGKLSIESALGAGTSIEISLPLIENVEEHSIRPSGNLQLPASHGARVKPSLMVASAPNLSQTEAPVQLRAHLAPVEASNQKLPLLAEKPSHAAEAARILAIDDEPEILSLVSVVLGKTGAQVVTLQDSTLLDSVIDENHFDAVLCDLKMPGQDGLAVLRRLREKRPELARHFLLMTGNLADADKALIELEDVPILPKPFTLGRLREMLAKVMAIQN